MTSEARTRVEFTDDAIEDLRRLGPDAVTRVLKKLLTLEMDPEAGHPLGGPLTGLRKLVVAKITWRIAYRVSPSLITVCEVRAIGGRRDSEVYRVEATRLAQASTDQPELTALAEVLAGMGHPGDDLDPPRPRREAVADWPARDCARSPR